MKTNGRNGDARGLDTEKSFASLALPECKPFRAKIIEGKSRRYRTMRTRQSAAREALSCRALSLAVPETMGVEAGVCVEIDNFSASESFESQGIRRPSKGAREHRNPEDLGRRADVRPRARPRTENLEHVRRWAWGYRDDFIPRELSEWIALPMAAVTHNAEPRTTGRETESQKTKERGIGPGECHSRCKTERGRLSKGIDNSSSAQAREMSEWVASQRVDYERPQQRRDEHPAGRPLRPVAALQSQVRPLGRGDRGDGVPKGSRSGDTAKPSQCVTGVYARGWRTAPQSGFGRVRRACAPAAV
ncbi:hypothetical protein FB451DRAFT_1185872 [Mycena latifolia]|nr:hypothetical protein FB451DRAFT_1185872 [Mycena latifolia]